MDEFDYEQYSDDDLARYLAISQAPRRATLDTIFKQKTFYDLTPNEAMDLLEEIADKRDATLLEKGASYLPDSMQRGALSALQQINQLGGVGEDDVSDIARLERGKQRAPMNIEDTIAAQKISEAKGVKDTFSAIMDRPSALGTFVAEGLAESVPEIASGVSGARVGAMIPVPGGSLAGFIIGSAGSGGGQEFAASRLQFLQEKGIDIADDDALKTALSNPELMKEVDDFAAGRGTAMAGTSALGAGLAGKFIGAGKNIARAAGAELGAQGAIGAGGEAAAQQLSEGDITRPGQVTLAGVLSPVTALPDIAIGASLRNQGRGAEVQTPIEEAISQPDVPFEEVGTTPNIKPDVIGQRIEEDEVTPVKAGPEYIPELDDPTPDSIPRIELPEEVKLEDIDNAIDLVRGDESRKESLSSYLKRQGGLQEDAGELKALDAYKGMPGLVSKKGLDLDTAAQRAWEDGFIQTVERPTTADFLELLSQDLGGDKVYRIDDILKAQDNDVAAKAKSFLDEIGLNISQFNRRYPDKKFSETPYAKGVVYSDIPFSAGLTSKAKPEIGNLETNVRAAIQRINPSVDVKALPDMLGSGVNLKKSGAKTVAPQPVAGGFDDARNIVYVSMNTKRNDPMDTAYHEAWHSIEKYLPERDRSVLQSVYPAIRNQNHSERTAIAFADWANNGGKLPDTRLGGVFNRIKSSINRLSNALKGRGFQNYTDIFERVKTGKLAEEAKIPSLPDAKTPTAAAQALEELRFSVTRAKDDNEKVSAIQKATNLDTPAAKGLLDDAKGILERDAAIKQSELYKKAPAALKDVFSTVMNINHTLYGSVGGALRAYSRQYNSKALANIADELMPEWGSGRVSREYYEEEKNMLVNRFVTRANDALAKLTPEESQKVVDKLRNRSDIDTTTGTRIDESAYILADLFDEYAARMAEAKALDAGNTTGAKVARNFIDLITDRNLSRQQRAEVMKKIKARFVEDYFPRIIDREVVLSKRDEFITDATKAYIADAKEKGESITPADAEDAAVRWFDKMNANEQDAFISGGKSGGASFMKERTLGKAAEKILDKYYTKNAIDIVDQYAHRASDSIAYMKRFGQGALKRYDKQMIAEGVPLDVRNRVFNAMIPSATGRFGMSLGNKAYRALEWMRYVNYLTTMTRATISSLGEPMAAAIQTGRLTDGIGGIITSVRRFAKETKTDIEMREALDDLVGGLNRASAMHLVSQRADLGVYVDTKPSRFSEQFFSKTGLTRLTMMQRFAVAEIGINYLKRIATELGNGKRTKLNTEILADLGVEPKQIKPFVEYVKSIETEGSAGNREMSDLYDRAARKFVDSAIQMTKKAERPLWANHPIGSMVYSLSSYINGFTQRVLLPSLRKAKRGVTGKGYNLDERIALLSPLLMLSTAYAAIQAAVWDARDEVFYNPEYPDAVANKDIYDYMDRAGLFGNYSNIYNAMSGAGAFNPLPVSLSGPIVSNIYSAGKTINDTIKDEKKGNTQERKAARELYSKAIAPMMNHFITASPYGGPVPGLAMMALSSPKARSAFADVTVGERTAPIKKKKEDKK